MAVVAISIVIIITTTATAIIIIIARVRCGPSAKPGVRAWLSWGRIKRVDMRMLAQRLFDHTVKPDEHRTATYALAHIAWCVSFHAT